ncbi:MAG: hypothetical protein V3W22_00965 [Thermoplasmata archaeon]
MTSKRDTEVKRTDMCNLVTVPSLRIHELRMEITSREFTMYALTLEQEVGTDDTEEVPH